MEQFKLTGCKKRLFFREPKAGKNRLLVKCENLYFMGENKLFSKIERKSDGLFDNLNHADSYNSDTLLKEKII